MKYIGLLISLFLLTACNNEEAVDKNKVVETPSAGELIVKKNCKVCHAPGLQGAPIIGNKKMWGKRLPKGEDALVQSAINGFGLMPAKGGNESLSDDDIRLAVQYFISQVK